jgi:flavin reductase (DIM6/NTAB) family NADH-FMN oxidoreductase RutF
MKVERRPSTLLLPVPAVLVTVADGEKNTIVTIAWAGTVNSAPPMLSVSIRPSRYSHELLERAREFVVNVPRASQVEQVDLCGSISGRDEDKWAAAGFTALPASKVQAPLIAECPINIECVVRHELALGAHDMFIGEILAVHCDEEVLDERGRLKRDALDALAYVDGEYWSLGTKVGTYGFSVKRRKADAS